MFCNINRQYPFGSTQGIERMTASSVKETIHHREIDITAELCPMTFVRTRLALDRMQPGEVLKVLLRGEEPRRNVPRTAAEQGHTVLRQEPGTDGTETLWIMKKG
jgi:tRNA 2-thiouridine synthesizing protein A